jgi:hypothetical protein
MQVSATPRDASSNAEAVIASTLCLMSFFGQTRCPQAAHKIGRNLQALLAHPDVSEAFRDVCESLLRHWHRVSVTMSNADGDADAQPSPLH